MGSFFDNVHVRTHNRPLVEQAWQEFWDQRGVTSWAWVSPVDRGWVSVFDWQCDHQDPATLTALAAHLSHAVATVAIAFQMQDSDLAEYWLYTNGKEADHYTSDTEYVAAFAPPEDMSDEGIYDGFGPDSRYGYAFSEDLSNGGNIELLKALTGTEVSDVELDAILRTPAYVADDIVTSLASALGMNDAWASLGYHYLVTEGDNVQGFDKFHHLPLHAVPNIERFTER